MPPFGGGMEIVMKKSVLSLFLALSIFTCACSSMPADTESTKPQENITQDPAGTENPFAAIYREREDSVPKLDLGGREIRVIRMESDSTTGQLYEDEIGVEALMSEPLNDAIYNRNLYVQERLNCKIVHEPGAGNADAPGEKLMIMFNSGDDTYQIISFQAARTMNLALDGYLYDLRSLENTYIDFDAPWWAMEELADLSVDEETYALAGALSLSMLRSVHATFYNKKIAEDYQVENLYNVVRDGRWTIDYQAELVASVYNDLNGNSLRDEEDRYGFGTPGYWATDSYWAAFDLDVLTMGEDDKYYISIDKDKVYTGVGKLYALCFENPGSFESAVEDTDTKIETIFASDRLLFMTNKLCVAETTTLRNMSSDYGILPMPKYDENQKEYGSMPFELFSMFSIPTTAKNPDELTAVLELMCAESWRKVVPTYSDVVLKGKYLNDSDSREMFELIIDTMRVEAGLLYCYHIDEISTFLMRYSIGWDYYKHFASTYASKIKKANIGLRFLNEKLG